MLTRVQFTAAFNEALDAVRNAEHITKRELKSLSRDLLTVLHAKGGEMEGDIQFVNALLGVLTPVNRRVGILFFKHFSGFNFSDELNIFTKKNKKHYEECRELAQSFLADPNQNIWTWADREVNVEQKPFDPNAITQFIGRALKKMDGDQAAVLRAVFAGGITPAAFMVVLEEITAAEQPVQE